MYIHSMVDPGSPLTRSADAAETLEAVGVHIRFLLTGADTGGGGCLLEYSAPANFAGPAAHYHVRATELYYVVEGELALECDGETRIIAAGGIALVPPRRVHRFFTGDLPARFLIQCTPAGLELYYRELAQLVRDAPSWPPAEMRPVMALGERHDTFTPRVG
jgi:mannose-6-phosphate isomerase-like protein (cupin superfamily)